MAHDPGPAFRTLHQPGNPFILTNAWDAGSARVLAALGAEALATTSAGHAFTLGRPDMGHVSRNEAIAHAADIVAAINLPVSGDLENGYGDDLDTIAETVRLAFEAGLARCSIEDTSSPNTETYAFELAVERTRAAASAARALRRDFVLVARADCIMNRRYDIEEAMSRLRAYEATGADCLYAPLPRGPEDLERICRTFKTPINALAAGPKYTSLTREDYAKMGVARISLGSALARVTHQALLDAAKPFLEVGDFTALGSGTNGARIDKMLS